MVGLQGSGKTTTTAKIAKRLQERDKRKVLMASLDTRRPAAQEQLAMLGAPGRRRHAADRQGREPGRRSPGAPCRKRGAAASTSSCSTPPAGSTSMRSCSPKRRRCATSPSRNETLLVADALTGQDAVNLAQSFDEKIGITGIVLTRIDGDGRGGAALSMRAVTGKPIKLMGTGEKLDGLEDFHPQRIAGRILGMGDVVSLVERAAQTIDADKAQQDRRAHEEGRLRSRGSRRAAAPAAEARRHVGHDGHAARHGQDQEAARRRRSRQLAC